MDKYTMLNKDWYCKENNLIEVFGYEAFTIIILLLKRRTVRNEVIFTIDYLRKSLRISKTSSDSRRRIIKILRAFEYNGLLKYNQNIDSVGNTEDITGDILVQLAKSESGGNYVMINDSELEIILNSNEEVDRNKLLTLFVYIKGCINEESKVWRISWLTLMEYTKIGSQKTIGKYLKILKKLGLILYQSAGTRVFTDGTRKVKECVSIFTMNEAGHEEILRKAIQDEFQRNTSEYYVIPKSSKSDKKRSDTMKKHYEELVF
jgi:hypothetical protein